jgi:hypothetical protein
LNPLLFTVAVGEEKYPRQTTLKAKMLLRPVGREEHQNGTTTGENGEELRQSGMCVETSTKASKACDICPSPVGHRI